MQNVGKPEFYKEKVYLVNVDDQELPQAKKNGSAFFEKKNKCCEKVWIKCLRNYCKCHRAIILFKWALYKINL